MYKYSSSWLKNYKDVDSVSVSKEHLIPYRIRNHGKLET